MNTASESVTVVVVLLFCLAGVVLFVVTYFWSIQYLWRGVRWPRATARVVGHDPLPRDPHDGWYVVEFDIPPSHDPIRAALFNGESYRFPEGFPIGSETVVAYNPKVPTVVTWPARTLDLMILGCLILYLTVPFVVLLAL